MNGLGLVTLDDALGSYHRVTSASTAPPKATTLALQSPPTSGVFGASTTVAAKLTENGTPVAGKSVLVSIGSTAKFDVTNAAGEVSATIPLSATPGATQVRASFAGDEGYEPSDDSAPFTVARAPASLSAFTAQAAVVTSGGATGVVTTLTANLGGKAAPLLQQTVTFTLTGPASKTYSTITDYLGRATLPATGLAPGTYSVTARYAGDATFTADTRTGTLVVSPFTGFLQPVDNPPTVNTVKAGKRCPDQVLARWEPRARDPRARLAGRHRRGVCVWRPDRRDRDDRRLVQQRASVRRGLEHVHVRVEDAVELRRLLPEARSEARRRHESRGALPPQIDG